jgi:hypothetical protein
MSTDTTLKTQELDKDILRQVSRQPKSKNTMEIKPQEIKGGLSDQQKSQNSLKKTHLEEAWED